MTAENVDVESLKIMTEKDFDELPIKYTIKLGICLRFKSNLKSWQRNCIKENATDKDLMTSKAENEIYSSRNTDVLENKPEINVTKILNSTPQGGSIFAIYSEKKMFTDATRYVLVDLIITYLHQNNIRMGVEICKNICEQLMQLFPSEINIKVSFFQIQNYTHFMDIIFKYRFFRVIIFIKPRGKNHRVGYMINISTRSEN